MEKIEEFDVAILKDGRKVGILEVFDDEKFLADDGEDAPFPITRNEIEKVTWKFKEHKKSSTYDEPQLAMG